MGTEAAWVPLVLAAVGTGASVYNTRRTAKKQDNALAAQIEGQGRKAREADARTSQLIDKTAASSPEDARVTALNQYVQQLRGADGEATRGLRESAGGASERYNREAAAAALGVGEYGERQAGLQARIDAPKTQRDAEAVDRNRATTDIGGIARAARIRDFLDGLATTRAGVRNPGIDAFAQLMTSAASSGMGSGGGAGYGGQAGQQGYMATAPTSGGYSWFDAYGARP